jgi:hypothetical protein
MRIRPICKQSTYIHTLPDLRKFAVHSQFYKLRYRLLQFCGRVLTLPAAVHRAALVSPQTQQGVFTLHMTNPGPSVRSHAHAIEIPALTTC